MDSPSCSRTSAKAFTPNPVLIGQSTAYRSPSHVVPVAKLACSFRVAVIIFFLIVVIVSIVTFVFLFVFFLVRLFSNEDIGDSRAMKLIGAEAFCVHCSHA